MSWQQGGFRAMTIKLYHDSSLFLSRKRHASLQTGRKTVCCSISGSGPEHAAAAAVPRGRRSSPRKDPSKNLDENDPNVNSFGLSGNHQAYLRIRRTRRIRSGAEDGDDDRHHGGDTWPLSNPCDNPAATAAFPTATPEPLRSFPMHPDADPNDDPTTTQRRDPWTAASTSSNNPHALLHPKMRRHRQRAPQGLPWPSPWAERPMGPGSGDDDGGIDGNTVFRGGGGGMDGNIVPPARDERYLHMYTRSAAPPSGGARTMTRRHGGGHEKQTSQWEMELAGGHGSSSSRNSGSTSGSSSSRNSGASSSSSTHRNGSYHGPRMDPKRINGVIMDAGTRRSVEEILQLVSEHGHYFSAVNVATALHRLGSCGLQPGSWEAKRVLTDPRFSQLLETLAEGRVQAFMPREVSNCLWALAKLGYPSSAEMVASSHGRGRGGGCHGRGETSHDGGRSGSGDEGACVLELLCNQANSTVGDFPQQEVTNTLWALGTLAYNPGESLLQNLTRRLLQLLPETAPQGIASALLGLAKLGWNPGPGVLDRVAHGSLTQIRDFNAQALSNTMWSLARLGHYNADLQAAIFQQALRRSGDFNPQGIANMVWAAATLGVRPDSDHDDHDGDGGDDHGASSGEDDRWRSVGGGAGNGGSQQQQQQRGDIPLLLLKRFCDQAVATLHTYTPQNVSNLLWATAKMGYRHKALLTAAADQAARQLKRGVTGDIIGGSRISMGGGGGGGGGGIIHWKAQEVANATWAYATLEFQPGPEYLGQVCRHLSSPQHLSGYKWQEIANTVWALASLQHRDCTAALAAVEREVVARLGTGIDGKQQQRQQQFEREQHIRSVRPADVSMLLWSYATLEHPAPDLFAALLPFLERRPGQFSEPELTSSVWAAATLGVYDKNLMDAVAQHICAYRLPYLHIHHVASIAWSYGELQHAHKPLFDGLVARAVSYPPPSPPPVAAAAAAASASISSADLTVLSQFVRLCCAAGVFGWRYSELLEVTSQRLVSILAQRRGGGGRRGGSSGGGRVAVPGASVVHAVQGGPAITAAAAATTATTAAAFAEAEPPGSPHGAEGRSLFGKEGDRNGGAGGSGPSINQNGDVTRAWESPAATAAAATQRLELLAANLSWGLSLVGGCSPEMWAQLMELVGGRVAEEGEEARRAQVGGGRAVLEVMPDEALRQLYQAYMYIRLDHPDAVLASGPPGLLDRAAEVWRFRSTWNAQVSQLQQQVSEALTRLGFSHSIERLIDYGDFSIDLAVEVDVPICGIGSGGGPSRVDGRPSSSPGMEQQQQQQQRHPGNAFLDSLEVSPSVIGPRSKRRGRSARKKATTSTSTTTTSTQVIRIAVEVDGPSHFTANTRQPLSPTMYRRRCLEDRGWVVVSVPFWRWNQCRAATGGGSSLSPGLAEQEEALLLELMREAGLGEVIEAVSTSGRDT